MLSEVDSGFLIGTPPHILQRNLQKLNKSDNEVKRAKCYKSTLIAGTLYF